jgi:PilZ domain
MISLHELMSGSRTMGNTIDRRTAVRYQLRAPVVFNSVDDQTAPPEAGYVRDISTEGVFVLCPDPRSVGEAMKIEILLPPFGTYDAKLVARYTSLVVRVEDEVGFAVAARVSLHRYIMSGRPPIPDGESQ